MIGYIAAAKSFEEHDFDSLHSFTYNELRLSVPSETYDQLVSGDFQHTVSADSSALKEVLPFYQIRPVYTGLIFLLYKTGVNIGFATHIISGVAVVAAVAILYLMSVSFLAKPLIYALPPLAVIFGIPDLAQSSSPDGLAFLAVLLSAHLYLCKRIAPLLLLFPIMIGIRTDLILFTTPFLLCILVLERSNKWGVVLSLFLSIAVYLAIGRYWENPGWSTIFHFTLVQIRTHPISMPPVLTVRQYCEALLSGTRGLRSNKAFILYSLMAAYSLYYLATSSSISNHSKTKTASLLGAIRSSSAVLAVVCVVFVVSHFLAFPVMWDRFFSGPWLIGAFSLLVMITNGVTTSTARQDAQ
jgi:hypothetical protein